MEKYENIEEDIFNAFDVSDMPNVTTTSKREENKITSQNRRMIH